MSRCAPNVLIGTWIDMNLKWSDIERALCLKVVNSYK